MMKRILAFCLALLLVLSGTALAEEAVDPGDEYTHLTVGTTNALSGSFWSNMFGNNTSDQDVRYLLHAYPLTIWDQEQGGYVENPQAVSGMLVMSDAEGNHIFLLELLSDLYYSDGSKITAWDYAFTMLMAMNPVVEKIGGDIGSLTYIKGGDEYAAGKTDVFSGVRVLSDTTLQITIKAEYLPNFYEMGLLCITPSPIKAIAPGCKVADDGAGAYICDDRDLKTFKNFTAQLLKKSLLDANTGYLSHPTVVSGPYTLVSFDGTTCEFKRNPYYKGSRNGITPEIEELTFTLVSNDTMIEQLLSGEVDLLNKVVKTGTVTSGIQAVRENSYGMKNYTRSGSCFINFCCEQPEVSSSAVRKAIAYCLDVDALVTEYCGYYGLRTNGYYGLGQWMVQILSGATTPNISEDDDGTEEAAWEEMSLDELTGFTVDLDAAARLLEEDGWKLNQNGIRYKKIDGVVRKLELKLYYPEGNAIGEWLETGFVQNLAQIGITLIVRAKDPEELLQLYYNQTERDCDMIYLASNFDVNFDPTATYEVGGAYNFTKVEDEKLAELAADMRKTEMGDTLTYCQKWLTFQKYWMEVMPSIPLYTNVYFDFFNPLLKNYNIGDYSSWGEAVVEANLGDGEAEQDEVEGEEEFSDEESFEGDDEEFFDDDEEFFDDDEEFFEGDEEEFIDGDDEEIFMD